MRAVQKHYNDSLAAARQKVQEVQKSYNDSITAARKYLLDSTRIAQKKYNDSVRAERDRIADSMAAIRSYLRSKQYNDSLELARKRRLDSVKLAQQQYNDSVKSERQRVSDSVTAVRQKYNDSLKAAIAAEQEGRQRVLDSMKAIRQRTADSLATIREYRQSDHFKDSVATVRKQVLDNMKAERKAYNDSLRTVRKATLDSTVAVRKAYNDSLRIVLDSTRAVRQQYLDSMKVVRLARADSLAKVKEAREAARKEKTKETEKKKGLALELKIKKKQDAYSNEKMRKKKWGIPRQIIQNTFTRYNYYYNANRKMEEAEANMLRTTTDNYDSLIAIFPFNPDRDSAKLKTDMDTIVHKASVGIQIHDPRSKWQDNLYLLAGQAFYYKGDYKNAAASFKYIVAQAEADKKEAAKKDKNKAEKKALSSLAEEDKEGLSGLIAHKSSKNEAMLWLSRTLTQEGQEGQAQALLDLLANDPNFPERLKGSYALEQAFIDMSRNDFNKATQSLAIVAEDKTMPDWIRQRTAFLNGQLLQGEGKYADAEKYFNIAIDLHPTLDMDFYARKNIVFNSLAGSDSSDVRNMLATMAADDKYRPYYDQVYYAMGKADLKSNQSDKALESFRKSVSLGQNNKKQKGLSYAALGDEYYKRNEYTSSKRSYDSAAMFLTPADEPVYSDAKQKSLSLDRIALPAREVQKQDSLLRLSALSEKEQRSNARKYIRDLERMMSDSAYMAENNPATFDNTNMNGAGSGQWYFANPTLIQQGSNEFKMKWGNRSLKDNWNRSGGGSSFDEVAQDEVSDEERIQSMLPDEDSLIAAIPHTTVQIQQANNKLKEAYYQLGKAYYSFVQDYAKAGETYDSLEKRYPDNEHSAEVLYHKYLMAMKRNKSDEAQQYNTVLQTRYQDSEWARLLKEALKPGAAETGNPLLTNAGGPVETISNHYDKTYGLLMQRQFAEVIARADDLEKLYPSQAAQYQKKYNLIKAVAIAGQGNYPKADTMLSQFLAVNPNDSLTAWANSVLNYIRKNTPPAGTVKPASADTTGVPAAMADTVLKAYNYYPGNKHYLIIYSPMMDGRFMGVKSGLADYNMMKHSEEGISVSVSSLQSGNGIIVCKEFNNEASAKKYMSEIKGLKTLFREYGDNKSEYELSIISADNLAQLLSQKDYANYKQFYKQKYR